MNTENQITKNDDENPFKDMGFIKFWIVSTVFWFSFPVSLVLCCLALGLLKTKQLDGGTTSFNALLNEGLKMVRDRKMQEITAQRKRRNTLQSMTAS